MDLQGYLRVITKRWKLIAATTLVIVALAALVTLISPKKYSSNVQFFVSTSSSDNTAALAQGNTFTQARVLSYTQLITTPKVLEPIADKLQIEGGAKTLAGEVASTVPTNTVLMNVTVTDKSATRAQQIAAQIGDTFPGIVDQLESTKADKSSPVNVTVVDQPVVATSPVSPKPARNLALGLILGLLLGLGLAVLIDRFDTRLRTKEDVEDVTEHAILGGIPFDQDAPAHPLVLWADPHSGRAEAFRSLRTNLQFVETGAEHRRSIVITSSLAGEGKTTTAANLAITLAESGASVCMIEGDLRRPRLLTYLGIEGGVGLTDVLIGRVDLDSVLQPFGEHALAILGAGAIPPNPSELLGSPAMRDVLRQLRDRFDYVLIDAPPSLPVTDAAVLSTITDGTLVVVGAGINHRAQLVTALESLDHVNANVLGLVVNRLPRKAGRGYYDYRYEYRPDTPGDPARPTSGARREDERARTLS